MRHNKTLYKGRSLTVCTSTTRPVNPFVGQEIFESDTNTLLVYYGGANPWRPTNLTVCTSSTRPASPYVGQQIMETDTGNILYYYSGVGFRQAWNMPWGLLDRKATAVVQAGITAIIDLVGLTSTLTYTANRRIQLTAQARFTANVGALRADLTIADSLNTGLTVARTNLAAATNMETLNASIIINSVAGSQTYKCRGLATANNMDLSAAAGEEGWLTVEDMGSVAGSVPV